MNLFIVLIISVFVFLTFANLHSKKSRQSTIRWCLSCLIILVGISVVQFLRVSKSVSNQIDPLLWAQFGAFIGSILLAATLIYQIISMRRQQVESKFFEMVKYYRDNITEMRFRNPFYYKDGAGRVIDEEFVHGRRVLKTIFEQYKVGWRLAEQIEKKRSVVQLCNEFDEIEKEIMKNAWNPITKKDWSAQYRINEMAYLFTYWGIPVGFGDELKKSLFRIIDDNNNVSKIIELVESIPALYECGTQASKVKVKLTKQNGKVDIKPESVSYIKFFGGNQYHLGHYFRHLYQTVKYIDEQPSWLLSKHEKYDYIKTLRAQMSNYEQALLFINSLTQLGRRWEYENEQKKDLISEYHLVKNLPETFIPEMRPQHFYPKVKFEWKK